MKNKNTVIDFLILLVLSAVLCLAALFASTLLTEDDLGQLAYLLFIFFPLAAAIIGVLTYTMIGKAWPAPVINLLAFGAFMLIKYGTASPIYLLVYMVISIGAYLLAYIVKRLVRK